MSFYNIQKPVSDMTIDELCMAGSDNYFRWLDTDGDEGDDCGAIWQGCENDDAGDECDVYESLLRYHSWNLNGYSREDLESYAS